MKEDQEKIPVFKTWKQWYIVVLAILVIQIVLYYIVTQSY
jgi:hypothetical protein